MPIAYKAIADFSDCYKKYYGKRHVHPQGIVVHSTGANNPQLSRYVNAPEICGENVNKNYFGGPYSDDVTPHGVIGKDKNGEVRAVQILPYDIPCWGCASGTKGSYNYDPVYIQFEIAEDNLSDRGYFEKAFSLAAKWCAELMTKFPEIELENIVSHKEAHARGYASNHGDPENWLSVFGKDMNWFRALVAKEFSNPKSETKDEDKAVFEPFMVRVGIANLNIRKGAGINYPTTGLFTGKGAFTIVEVKSGKGSENGWGRLKSGAGWISLDYVTRL